MFRQVLDVDKVITQLLAGRKKTDKQANICFKAVHPDVLFDSQGIRTIQSNT